MVAATDLFIGSMIESMIEKKNIFEIRVFRKWHNDTFRPRGESHLVWKQIVFKGSSLMSFFLPQGTYHQIPKNFDIEQGWPNFLDRGSFSEIWTKARATSHNSIFSLYCRYVL